MFSFVYLWHSVLVVFLLKMFKFQLQYARGDLVELLISSNIARYSEYRSVSRVLVWLNGHLEVVPCSRSDVFSNDRVSVIEKRMLMKLLTSLDEESEEAMSMLNNIFELQTLMLPKTLKTIINLRQIILFSRISSFFMYFFRIWKENV